MKLRNVRDVTRGREEGPEEDSWIQFKQDGSTVAPSHRNIMQAGA